ncbi:MAG: hypothetical protein P4M11_03820 [Candidatus Pacebacteria bacterium]|nr:hypothetical protein [Candidatus Paceibacterota bacterium]
MVQITHIYGEGVVAGGVIYCLNDQKALAQMQLLHGNFVSLFMVFLLPVIIFEAGYNMHKASSERTSVVDRSYSTSSSGR